MKIAELLLAELDREAPGIRKTLERVPAGKNYWKPHEKSMPLGYLATIVATIPGWIEMVVNMDELDITVDQSSSRKSGKAAVSYLTNLKPALKKAATF
jgi:hypothetical protein